MKATKMTIVANNIKVNAKSTESKEYEDLVCLKVGYNFIIEYEKKQVAKLKKKYDDVLEKYLKAIEESEIACELLTDLEMHRAMYQERNLELGKLCNEYNGIIKELKEYVS